MAIDTHCHLTLRFEQYEIAGVLERARKAGVDGAILVGYNPAHYIATESILDQFGTGGGELPSLAGSIGIHPHDADKYGPADIENFHTALERPDIIAIGETGLDFFRDYAPRDRQEELFRAQVQLSSESGFPLIIHSRSAFAGTIGIIEEYKLPEAPGVFHCYGYGPREVEKVIELGFYISFAGNLTYSTAEELRSAARSAPADRILIETDSPFLIPNRSKNRKVRRCEPALVMETLDKLAEVRGKTKEQLEPELRRNVLNCFPKLRTIASWNTSEAEVAD